MSEIQTTKQYYERNAQQWASLQCNSFQDEVGFRLFRSYLNEGETVIDFGCANGIHVPLFLGIGHGLIYTGVDISNQFLIIARERYPQLHFLEGNLVDADTLPKEKYDGVWCPATLMHIPLALWDVAITNIYATMKNGAVAYFTLPTAHPNAIENAEDTRHFTILSQEEQREQFLRAGFKILHNGVKDDLTKRKIWQYYLLMKN